MGLVLSGCGKSKKSNRAVTPIWNSSYSTLPLMLEKQVLNCTSKRDFDARMLGLYLFTEGRLNYASRDFTGLIDERRVADKKAVAVSVYGEVVEYVYQGSSFNVQQHAQSKEIDLCADVIEYDRNTVEGAALNATYYINRAHRIFTESTGSYVPPVKLNISPEVRQTFVNGANRDTFYLTDNALYLMENKSIVFLPHSLEAKSAGFYMNFWEIPMVPAHEYGHHIFASLMDFSFILRGGQSVCFNFREDAPHSQAPRKIKNLDVLHAFNEGFADLVAHYTLPEEDRGFKGVKCMEVTRDVSQPNLMSGTPKTFSPEALRSFFSSTNEDAGNTCEQSNFQDVHVIGAIFAYNADRFMSQYTDSTAIKLQILKSWVESLRRHHWRLSSLGSRRYFEEVFELFLRLSLEKFDRKFDRSSCEEVNKIYPGFVENLPECS